MRRGASSLISLVAVGALALGLSACSAPKKAGPNGAAVSGTGVGQPSPFLSANLTTLSCGPGSLCSAGGTPFESGAATPLLAFSHTAGAKWSPARTSTGAGATITSTACAARRCLAIGVVDALPLLLSISASSTTRTWVAADQPAAGTLLVVGCAGTSTCVGLARSTSGALSVVRSTSGPWTTLGAAPADLAAPVRVSCTSPAVCTALGTSATGAPVVVITRDGGADWSLAQISKRATLVLGASCRVDGACWVVGRKGSGTLLVRSTRPGAPFAKVLPPEGLATANDVSCASRTCVVVGADASGTGAAATFSGTSGTILRLSYAPTALLATSCGSATTCAAVTSASLVSLAP